MTCELNKEKLGFRDIGYGDINSDRNYVYVRILIKA